jgi:hypothetical protein
MSKDCEYARMEEEAVLAGFEVLSQHSSAQHKKSEK